MDMLNYSNSFFDIPGRQEYPPRFVNFEEDLESATKKIKDFINAATRSGYTIVGFIDKSISTEETMDKWRMRRSEELRSGKRMVMTNMSLFLGSIFQSFGVTVHFSTVDCDDTIAAFAYHLNGNVLSGDCDFFRYTTTSGELPFLVYRDFQMFGGKLMLNKHNGPGAYRQMPPPRRISPSLPETRSNTFFLDIVPLFMKKEEFRRGVNQLYQRGCGSNLTRLENPHITARCLRQGLYQTMGYGKVMEIIANWDAPSSTPEFKENLTKPSSDMKHLLEDPKRAFKTVFGKQKRIDYISSNDWRNHVFSEKSVIAELCAWATGGNIMDTMNLLMTK